MIMHQHDPDVVRWGLHLLDGCHLSDNGSPPSTLHYERDLYQVQYVHEGFNERNDGGVENDEIIARAYQEELERVAETESFGSSKADDEHLQVSVLSQDWHGSSRRYSDEGHPSSNMENYSSYSPEIENESSLDGEVGKRLNQMVPIPHVPKVNGAIPSTDEEMSDHQRLLERLDLYELIELKVEGDGNCQFRALSDQIYRTADHHKTVRQQIVDQLKYQGELYEGYVPMTYDEYVKKISMSGEWGDHVTLQAASDVYGVKIFVLTSFKDTCYIEILPRIQKSKRIIFLSFWAEVHYNSIYPEGELPTIETKKKSWWPFSS
ncbi:OVARIAN TUMOR DOMAIN-containing deubiquitinating enzyme 9-like [Impatiens glandulifera]|uniref:OVARIAN TUMOR DOMAIN-containing deubiquitinating enzyme 9-like n=1 Tax=Impatiens glandulifera TaxID=253017 RepID=UPI001FB14BFB|nr:OVARIAN TUMOR DOMAIN-containing deubiquitinating enzyme 9-like [Impatiens glandulifera]XP_047324347.1 OVARIAN TUMOR DOMAIN-containing deubiquitinating enzyme 9-like [Impatiens glandulifera]